MKSNLQIRNVIFDFGGVILDIDPQQINIALERIGYMNHQCLNAPEFQEEIINKFERGILTPEVFRQKVRDYLGFYIEQQEIDDIWNSMLLDIPKERIRVLEQAKNNYQIYLLSNSNEIHYDVYVRDLQLRFGYRDFDHLFHKSYFSFDLHMSKPNPEIFEFVMYQHQLNPKETLFIDDTLQHIEAAKKLGFRTYQLVKPERVRDIFDNGILIDRIINSFED